MLSNAKSDNIRNAYFINTIQTYNFQYHEITINWHGISINTHDIPINILGRKITSQEEIWIFLTKYRYYIQMLHYSVVSNLLTINFNI